MKIEKIKFKFKGQRDYIQGPDIYNMMMDLNKDKQNISNIKFTAHEFINIPDCRAYLTNDKSKLQNINDIRARLQFLSDGELHYVAITQDNVQKSFVEREEYNEELVTSICGVEDNKIKLLHKSPFTFIETVVSMNKFLHQNLFGPISGKWIFTRIDLIKQADFQDNIEIDFKHNMNFKLTKSDVIAEGVKIGDVYFSLVKS